MSPETREGLGMVTGAIIGIAAVAILAPFAFLVWIAFKLLEKLFPA